MLLHRQKIQRFGSLLLSIVYTGTVILSDNESARVVTVWPWHYDEPALCIMQSQR